MRRGFGAQVAFGPIGVKLGETVLHAQYNNTRVFINYDHLGFIQRDRIDKIPSHVSNA
jgi:hypothetical protein